jgi:CRISPR-associated exonuclease Cas4
METLPLSLLNDHLYCPRRAALKLIEGWRESNAHTERGDIVHEHADLPGYEVAKGVTVWRALPVWSDRLGLSGKCDVVEVELETVGKRQSGQPRSLCPVEYKKGKRRRFENDDAQLCAQALCLEEMFGIAVPRGAIFHAESKRRREVELTPELRQLTERALGELHALLDSSARPPPAALPAASYRPACEECSLFPICLPKAAEGTDRIARVTGNLFRV